MYSLENILNKKKNENGRKCAVIEKFLWDICMYIVIENLLYAINDDLQLFRRFFIVIGNLLPNI